MRNKWNLVSIVETTPGDSFQGSLGEKYDLIIEEIARQATF